MPVPAVNERLLPGNPPDPTTDRSWQIWTKFTSKLFRATALTIMTSIAKALSEGKRLTLGDIVVSDDGCEVPTHHMFRNHRIQAPWSDLKIWSSDGFFVVGVKSNDKAYGSTS